MQISTPLKNVTPPLSQQPPSKSWGPAKPPLFENLFGGSTPPAGRGGGGGAHYAIHAIHKPFMHTIEKYSTFKSLAVFKLKQILKSSVSEHSFLIYLETKRKTRIL